MNKTDSSFVDYIVFDLLSDLEGLEVKQMFGSFAIYLRGVIVGAIYEGELYLKFDKKTDNSYLTNPENFFVYRQKNKELVLPYKKVSPEVLEDRFLLMEMVIKSFQI